MRCRAIAAIWFPVFGKRVGKASEVAHGHPHGEILTLYEAGGDVLMVWRTRNRLALDTEALAAALAGLSFASCAIDFD